MRSIQGFISYRFVILIISHLLLQISKCITSYSVIYYPIMLCSIIAYLLISYSVVMKDFNVIPTVGATPPSSPIRSAAKRLLTRKWLASLLLIGRLMYGLLLDPQLLSSFPPLDTSTQRMLFLKR